MLAKWLCQVPAQQTRISDKKGQIAVGYDADFVIWRPETPYEVKVEDIHFKNKLSPYVGHTLYGEVDQTILRGRVVFDKQSPKLFASVPAGQPLLK